jgi:hypothetical protein
MGDFIMGVFIMGDVYYGKNVYYGENVYYGKHAVHIFMAPWRVKGYPGGVNY